MGKKENKDTVKDNTINRLLREDRNMRKSQKGKNLEESKAVSQKSKTKAKDSELESNLEDSEEERRRWELCKNQIEEAKEAIKQSTPKKPLKKDKRTVGKPAVKLFNKQNNEKLNADKAKDVALATAAQYFPNEAIKGKRQRTNKNKKFVSTIGWDTEFTGEKTHFSSLSYMNVNNIPFELSNFPYTVISETDKRAVEGVEQRVHHNNGDYLFGDCVKAVVSIHRHNNSNRGNELNIVFLFDTYKYNKGVEFWLAFSQSLKDVEGFCGFCPFPYQEKMKKSVRGERSDVKITHIVTTFSIAELSAVVNNNESLTLLTKILADTSYTVFNPKDSKDRGFLMRGNLFDVRGSYHCNMIPLITKSGEIYEFVKIIDTTHLDLGSVKDMGENQGYDKVDAYKFNDTHTAEYYYRKDYEGFGFYCCRDAEISARGYKIFYDDLFKATKQLESKGLLKSAKEAFKSASRKFTVSGIAVALHESYLKKNNMLKVYQTCWAQLKEKMPQNDLRVEGGLNKRTTNRPYTEVFKDFHCFDFKSHYPTIMIALDGKFPLYQPVGAGSGYSTPKKIYEWSKELGLDYYILFVDFDIEDGENIQLTQKDKDNTIYPRKPRGFKLHPAFLEYLLMVCPDKEIKVTGGWEWNPHFLSNGEKANYYNPGPFMKGLIELRDGYKETHPSLADVFKKIANSIYGKIAQSKEYNDTDLVNEAIINGWDINSVGFKSIQESSITNTVFANIITATGRAVTAYFGYKTDAVLLVTDSFSTEKKVSTNLQDYKTGLGGFIDSYCDVGFIKDETPEASMALVSNTRGRVLFPKDDELYELFLKVENQEAGEDTLREIYSRLYDMKAGMKSDEDVPKIARGGLRFEGGKAEEWFQCAVIHVRFLNRLRIKVKQKSLNKPSAILNDKTNEVILCQGVERTVVKDGFDVSNFPCDDAEDSVAIRKLVTRIRKADANPLELYFADKGAFGKRMKSSRPRVNHGNRSVISSKTKRQICYLLKFKVISGQEIADVIGVSRASINNWLKEFEKTEDIVSHWLAKDLGITTTTIEDVNKTLGDINEMDLKRILKNRFQKLQITEDYNRSKEVKEIIVGIISNLEKEFKVNFVKRSRNAVTLKIIQDIKIAGVCSKVREKSKLGGSFSKVAKFALESEPQVAVV